MDRLRILIVVGSPLLRDILVRGLSREPRLEVEALPTSPSDEALASALLRHEPDAILLGDEAALESRDALRLLYDHPQTVIITLEDDGKTAAVRRLQPEVSFLTDVSIQALVGSILQTCESIE